jgi:hypothetical protein
MKTRLQALAQLDRALAAMTDDELEALVATLPDDHRKAIDRLAGARDDEFSDPAARTLAIRGTAARGRMSGGLEQLTTILTDPLLAEFITELGDDADNPSEERFLEVAPALVERHGIAAVRLTMAASVAGEAAAAAMLSRLLKHDPTLALPPRDEAPEPTVYVKPVDPNRDAVVERRRASKAAKQEAARQRREQQARARNRA